MSSNSSANDAVASLLAESFDVVKRELPAAYADLVRGLAAKRVRIEVGEERFDVRVGPDGVVVEVAASLVASARIATDRGAILDVLEARATLREVVLDGRLAVMAELANVEALYDVLIAYTHAAVRCPSFPALLRRFGRTARPLPGAEAAE